MMNLKWSKKFLSLVLVLVMTVLAIPVSVSASEAMLVHDLLSELGITIEIDNEQQIVVREVTSYGSVLSTNDRISNILTIEKFDSHGNIISVDVVNLDITFEQNGYIDIQPFNQSQTTFSNREYWMRTSWFSAGSHSDPHWEIRSGNSRRSGLESQVNSHSDLMAFRSVV
ncbi:MAG: hypothetical protein FWG63_00395, partial [Defluviitaleaceae bacterium]|nr:hypothetical protein [Defluviitaleaceae bacterium]